MKKTWDKFAPRYRRPLLMAVDFLLFSASYFTSWFILLRRIAIGEHLFVMLLGYAFFILIFFLAFWVAGMYESLWRYAEAYEFFKLMLAAAVAVVLFVLVTWLAFQPPRVEARLPITVYFISGMMAAGSTMFVRTAYRALRNSLARRGSGGKRKKVLIVGAGETGLAIIHALGRAPAYNYEIVCAVDDDPQKQRRKILNIPVAGAVQDIPKLVDRHGIQVILLAVPHATGKERRRISSICAKTSCQLKKIPDIFDFETDSATAPSTVTRIEDVSVEDLLGRDVIDVKRFKDKYLAGQTVLITGAGGTIGSELCRQAALHGAARIIMLDVVENGIFQMKQELDFKFGQKIEIIPVVANIREEARLDSIFAAYKPNLVYHAAAHKHVSLMEAAPEEAVKNNIFGTINVANAAKNHGTKRFVLISTDKAVNPTNVYGVTKRVCEMIVQNMASPDAATEFTMVRFGNVLASNGSVIPIFKAQIAAGGPVRVTHKEIIRYYMTVTEAVSLVMAAAEMAKNGEIFVLDMGDPVKTLDLAEMLIRLSGLEPYKDIPIEFIGLFPGEKLYEELLTAEEGLLTTKNKKIFTARPIQINKTNLNETIKILHSAAYGNNKEELLRALDSLVPFR